jgi:4-aminobutyrate aminotransferase-like enzyme
MNSHMQTPQLPPIDHRPKEYEGPTLGEIENLRRRYLSPALLTYYKEPLMIVEGSMQYLYDETGRRYLDGFGGIVTVSVGHSHPYVLQKAGNSWTCFSTPPPFTTIPPLPRTARCWPTRCRAT